MIDRVAETSVGRSARSRAGSSGSPRASSTDRSASAARRVRGRASSATTARCGQPTRTAYSSPCSRRRSPRATGKKTPSEHYPELTARVRRPAHTTRIDARGAREEKASASGNSRRRSARKHLSRRGHQAKLNTHPCNGAPHRRPPRSDGETAGSRLGPPAPRTSTSSTPSRSRGRSTGAGCRPRPSGSWTRPPPPPPVGERLQRREAPEPSPGRRRRRGLRHRSSLGPRLLQLTREGAGDRAPEGADRVPPGAMPPPCGFTIARSASRSSADWATTRASASVISIATRAGDLDARLPSSAPRGSRWRAASAVSYPRSATNRGEDLAIPSPRAFAVVAFP